MQYPCAAEHKKLKIIKDMSKRNETELYVNCFFSNTDKNTMTVNCPDEDSEMSIVIRDNGKKSIYSMSIWEAEQLRDFLKAHIKNYKESEK